MMSIFNRHFLQKNIALNYSSLYSMKLYKVSNIFYAYFTHLLSVKTRSKHLIPVTMGISFIENYFYFIDLSFLKRSLDLKILYNKFAIS